MLQNRTTNLLPTIASKQLERMLGVTYKTARFMSHRIREAMTSNGGGFFGGNGDAVEVDETYWGNTGKQRKGFVRFSKRKYMKDRG